MNDYEKLIDELSNPTGKDRLYEKALIKTYQLEIFKGEAVIFYVSMYKFHEEYLQHVKNLERFQCEFEVETNRRKEYNFSWKENEIFEQKWYSIIRRLEHQKCYLNFCLLFQYSIIIEGAINRDTVMMDRHEMKKRNSEKIKVEYFNSKIYYDVTNSSWIKLISNATNYTRHFAEWRNELYPYLKLEGDLYSNIENAKLEKNIDRRIKDSILPLLEISTLKESLDIWTDELRFTTVLINELGLLDFEKSFKKILIWLLRLEMKWADQFYSDEDKYFPKKYKNLSPENK